MTACNFIDELSKLRKSSKDSVDNTESFDDFKKYIHVTRNIEIDLKNILENVNESDDNALILLCGSAGDGKSHLLSYLKNDDTDNLLVDYTIYNDGTESFSPDKTAVDTLNELLNDYSDDRLLNGIKPNKSIILAINLGVLNNFIESKYGNRYGMLKKYVQESEILTSSISKCESAKNKYFQSINFSDYHMYNLTEEGINVVFLNSLMNKIFGESEDSPFYKSYKENCCGTCVKSKTCPIKHNYEFMQKQKCQKFVSQLLVECILKDKLILTVRELQNFLFDIVVPLGFDPLTTMNSTNVKQRINTYLKSLTPSLMFEQKDTSDLINTVKKYDPIVVRNEKTDIEAIDFYVVSNVGKVIEEKFGKLSYKNFILDSQIITKLASDKIYRSQLFSTIKRCELFTSAETVDDVYKDYLKNLYYYNTKDTHKLGGLYQKVENAVKQWCGTDSDDNLCVECTKNGYSLYEEVDFQEYTTEENVVEEKELTKFSNYIVVSFKNEYTGEPISLVIDYGLYELIEKLNKGYIQTSEDRNNHADFLTFIKKIKNNGGAAEKVIVKGPNDVEVVFVKKNYGYTYKRKQG